MPTPHATYCPEAPSLDAGVDIVYLWVDGSDPVWQRKRRQAYANWIDHNPNELAVFGNAAGRYRESGEILSRLVFAQPANQEARNLLADTFEQLGYQSESTSFRNSYLQLAAELRTGIAEGTAASSTSPT